MDGNDSLKRVTSAKTVISEDSEVDTSWSRVSQEWKDLRDVGDEYFIPWDEVNSWGISGSTNLLHEEEVCY